MELGLSTGKPCHVIAGGGGIFLGDAEFKGAAFRPSGGGVETIHPRSFSGGAGLGDIDDEPQIPWGAGLLVWASGDDAAGCLADDGKVDVVAPGVLAEDGWGVFG